MPPLLLLDDLTEDLLLRVFEHLALKPLAAAERASARWRATVQRGHARLWRARCLEAWRLAGPQPALQLPPALSTPAQRSAGWKDVLRDVYARTSRWDSWAAAKAKGLRDHRAPTVGVDTAAHMAKLDTACPPGTVLALPTPRLLGDRDGELVVEQDVVRLHADTPIGGDRAARCERPFHWISAPAAALPATLPPAGLGMPLLERTVAGSDADHILRRRQCQYYEVTLRAPAASHAGAAQDGEEPCTAIGLATRSFRTNGSQPGWTRNSWGYHGDDGMIYHRTGQGSSWGPAFGAGDVVGCGVDCFLQCVWFTKNGKFMGVSHDQYDDISRGLRLFPVIGLDSWDEVELNTLGPFQFSLGQYEDKQRAAVKQWWRGQGQIQRHRKRTRPGCQPKVGEGVVPSERKNKIVVVEEDDPRSAAAAADEAEQQPAAAATGSAPAAAPASSTASAAPDREARWEQVDCILRAMDVWANEERAALQGISLPQTHLRHHMRASGRTSLLQKSKHTSNLQLLAIHGAMLNMFL